MDTLYLDLESSSDLLKLSDPVSFFEMHADKLIIFDEIQRMPDFFNVLRGVIDSNRNAVYQKAKMAHPEHWSGDTRNWIILLRFT
jgi:predicted AAA+ superfamily ATPase